jgi:hypothetical protein
MPSWSLSACAVLGQCCDRDPDSRRARVRVATGVPVTPAGEGWPAAIALRDQSRAAVLALSGEADAG